ncbi:hypothetical protein ACET3Z_002985 [Daucus carota]
MEEIINEGLRRSPAVYNLSETDNFNSYQEVDSEDLDSEELDGSDDANDSDSSSHAGADGQNNEANYTEEHTPSAPWFATEDVTNNDNPGFIPNFNPLTDDLFEVNNEESAPKKLNSTSGRLIFTVRTKYLHDSTNV